MKITLIATATGAPEGSKEVIINKVGSSCVVGGEWYEMLVNGHCVGITTDLKALLLEFARIALMYGHKRLRWEDGTNSSDTLRIH